MTELIESARMYTQAVVEKYSPDQVEYAKRESGLLEPTSKELYGLFNEPEEGVTEGPQPGNLLTTAGLGRLTGQLLSNTQVWDTTHTALGVGDTGTTAVIGNTALAGTAATGQYYQQTDASYPQASAGVLTFKSTFGTTAAVYAWNEYAIAVPNTTTTYTSAVGPLQASYVLLNRKAAVLGTKGAGSTWVFTVTITIA